MEFKNYYKILHINHSSSIDVIKKSFRKFALQYHPDITNNNFAKAEQFKQIKEAYDVLSNPDKRKAYDAKFFFINKKEQILTIEGILLESEKVKRFAEQSNPLKIDYGLLNLYLNNILCELNINILEEINNDKQKQLVLSNLLSASNYLTLRLLQPFCEKLKPLLKKDIKLLQQLEMQLANKKKQDFWQRYKVVFVIVAAIIVCLFIALSGKL